MLALLRQTCIQRAAELRGLQLLLRAHATAASPSQQPDMIPLSEAVQQLESVLLHPSLPPAAHAANQAALTTLRSFVAGLSNPESYPAASIQTVRFTHPAGNTLRCLLKTTGGDCSRLVQHSLGQLLHGCGLNAFVYFDKGEFQPKPTRAPRRAAPRRAPAAPPPSPADVDAVRARAAAAGFPSQAITEAQFEELEADQDALRKAKEVAQDAVESLQADLARLDPLLKACAALPWMAHVEGGLERSQRVRTEVVDHLEGLDWDIRGPLAKLWAGERSEGVLTRGKEGGSKAAVQALLFHAKLLDIEYGKKTMH
jgi:hypothetical protein